MAQTTELLEAIIEHEGDEKYVVLEVEDQGSKKELIVSMPLDYHHAIVREYQRRLLSSDSGLNQVVTRVLGGGILQIDHKTKTIKTYGTSGSYGKPDPDRVKHLLKNNFPDYKLDVRVTDYVRG